MKKTFLKIFAMLAVASVLTVGCTNLKNMVNNHDRDAEYVQTPNPMENHGDVVKINIAGSFKPNYFHKNAGMLFQPELKYDGGSLLLKPIVLKGESANDLQGTTIPRTGGKFTYTEDVPFAPELKDAKLIVSPTVFVAKRAKNAVPTTNTDALAVKGALPLSEKTIATGVNVTPQLVDFTDATPSLGKDNYTPPKNIFQKSALFFAKDLWNLNTNLPTNRAESARTAIAEMSKALASDQEIASITITAWASPEGEEFRNENLSKERSRTGDKYLRDAYKKVIDDAVRAHNAQLPRGARRITARELTKDLPITLEHKGEDWDGFMTALRASNVSERDRILNVIGSNTDRARREQEMRNMIVIYPEIEDVLLPPLRRTEFVIELVVPAKTDEEMKDLALNDSKELTVEELLFAASLLEEKEAKWNVYTAAAEIYQDDWRGSNNMAYLFIQDGKYETAEIHLKKANELSPNNGVVLNNLGVVALNSDDIDGAKRWFTDARSRGSVEAGQNLGLILIREGDYNGAIAAFGNQPGNLNLALAQMLSGNIPAAKQTLSTAPNSPIAFYLKAILAAREDNVNEVVSNLRQTNADFKKQAQTDVEFQKIANTAEFVNAVR
ncbi:MAG: hypothetical protein FWG79_04690 [Bacteroidales bacterium]|nr:hypothetical protein [Bacteroidales bacterium]